MYSFDTTKNFRVSCYHEAELEMVSKILMEKVTQEKNKGISESMCVGFSERV